VPTLRGTLSVDACTRRVLFTGRWNFFGADLTGDQVLSGFRFVRALDADADGAYIPSLPADGTYASTSVL